MTATLVDAVESFVRGKGGDQGVVAPPRSDKDLNFGQFMTEEWRNEAVDSLMRPRRESAAEDEAVDSGATAGDDIADTKDSMPYVHDASVLLQAQDWGITPDIAQQYPTQAELTNAIAMRAARWGATVRQPDDREVNPKPVRPTMEAISLGEDADPQVVKALKGMEKHTASVTDFYERRIADLERRVAEVDEGRQLSEARQIQDQEQRIANIVDAEVKSWGKEFEDVIGVPTKSIRATEAATEKGKNAVRLRQYLLQRKIGYEGATGRAVTPEMFAEFAREAKGALFGEVVQKEVRRKIGDAAKKVKAGQGLSNRVSHGKNPVDDSYDSQLSGVKQWLDDRGLSPWGK